MKSLRELKEALSRTEKKKEEKEVKEVKKVEKEEVENPQDEEMGWMDILFNLKRLSDSKEIEVQVRNLEKIWKPLINDLEKMLMQVQAKHNELLMPQAPAQPSQSAPPDPVQQFLAITKKMVTKAKVLTESLDFDLYFVADKKEAHAITTDNAIIIYQGADGKDWARVITRKSHSDSYDVNVDLIIPPKYIESIKKCKNLKRNEKNEVILTESNIDLVEEITKKLAKKAGIILPKKKFKNLLSGALSLANDVPAFLSAFAKLPIVPMIRERLNQFKTEKEEFDFSSMLKTVLPVEMYKQLRQKAFDALKPAEFKLLSRDKQAAALALMESYNTAIKFAMLAIDKIEIENGLVPSALSTKIKLIDNKSMKELCEEFNEVYTTAMNAAGFSIYTELYPYHSSILDQRKAMLAALPAENKENASILAAQKKRIQERIDILGDVKELPKRENAEDFYKFMQSTLREGYERLEELKKQLAPEEKKVIDEVKDDVKPIDLTKEAKSIISKAEKELKEVLDEKIFQIYFTGETVADKKSPWIQQVASAFHHINKIVAKIELLQQQHPELLASDTPFQHLEHRVKEVSELAAAGAELIMALNQLKDNAHLKRVISVPLMEGMVLGKEWKKQVEIAAGEAKSVAEYVKKSGVPLTEVIRGLKIIIQEKANVAGIAPQTETITALTNVAVLATELELLYKGLEKDAKEQPNLLMFAATHFTQIVNIMSSLPRILSTLNKLAKKDAMHVAAEINSALKQMMLLADKLEIQFCLKEGYLANGLRPMMMSYYKKLNEMGYDFPAAEHYPFSAAIAEQRAQLLKDENSPDFLKDLIQDRMTKSKRRFDFDKARISLQEKFEKSVSTEKVKKEMDSVISQHIEQLELLKNDMQLGGDFKTKKVVGVKIGLLIRFRQIVSEKKSTQPIQVDEVLQQLREENPKNIHLLYEGNTGEMLKKLEYKNASPDDIVNALDMELAQLKKQHGTTHYIYSIHKANLLEERINACEKLKNLVKDHNLSDALDKLDPNEKNLLEKYDRVFLDQLKLIEQAIPVERRTKTIIETAVAKNDPVQAPVVVVEDSAEQKYAIQLLDRRLAELEAAIFQTDIKRLKIKVLSELKKELKPGVSLEAAINKVKSGDQAKNAHLLFEGRTGKAIRAAQNITITRTELVYRLDAEINDLKRQRYTHLHVFAQSRKATGDEHIEVLQKLRAAIKDSDKSVKEIISGLNSKDKSVLQRYDADLLKDFGAFEKVAAKRQLGAR